MFEMRNSQDGYISVNAKYFYLFTKNNADKKSKSPEKMARKTYESSLKLKKKHWNRTLLKKRKRRNKIPTQILLSRKSNLSPTGRHERPIKFSVSVVSSWKFFSNIL